VITTRQLRYLDAIARLGHFGRAAQQCAVSQPALSMQIAELESKLGVLLVERRPKGVTLTEPGREIARRASRILDELRDISDYAAQCGARLAAPIRFGIIPTVAPYVLPPLLPVLRDRYPALELLLRETHTHDLTAGLLDGTLDLLLLALPVDHSEIETMPLHVDRFLLALPPDRLVSGRVLASLEPFRNDRILLLEEGHCLREQALAVCQLREARTIDTFGASSLSTIVQLVANGMGLTLLPEISLALETGRGEVQIARFADPEPNRTLGLAWRKTSARRNDFEEFGRLVADVLDDVGQRARARHPD
jgi:LysR family hydrogen peroxide-inducible transcriptional activator